MMTSLDYEVYLYGGPFNDAVCKEHIACITQAEQDEHCPDKHQISWDATQPIWTIFAANAIPAIAARAEPGDYLCIIGGNCQKPIADALPHLTAVEFGIGYTGTFTDFRVFESYAWMHTCYGQQYGAYEANGRFYDTVIPNYFDPDDFPLGDGSGDYLLYIGRLMERKGLAVVGDIAERTGLPLLVAGAGDEDLIPKGAQYEGVVGPESRAKLMGNARCVLVPTLYVEPFGGVAVEAQMCGTPVITTDWGAFTENVYLSDFRCRTLAEFCEAVDRAPTVDREDLRTWAVHNYSTDRVKLQYDKYFKRLEGLKGKGWYE
jgi:glycosyltransferase involved in cell wall biosynthesis